VATEGEDRYSNTLKDLPALKENTQLWRDVFAFKESLRTSIIAMLHHNKAQGSTINHVFIIEDDILEVKLTTTKEKLQSINVGISRAYRAYIYNKIYKVDNSNLDKNYFKWMYHERG
jgi:hypothetical protein